MWIPRFTLRTVLKAVTLCAMIALIAGQAVAGQFWAIAATIAIAGAVLFFMVYAASFAIMQMIPLETQLEVLKPSTPAHSNPPADLEEPLRTLQ